MRSIHRVMQASDERARIDRGVPSLERKKKSNVNRKCTSRFAVYGKLSIRRANPSISSLVQKSRKGWINAIVYVTMGTGKLAPNGLCAPCITIGVQRSDRSRFVYTRSLFSPGVVP